MSHHFCPGWDFHQELYLATLFEGAPGTYLIKPSDKCDLVNCETSECFLSDQDDQCRKSPATNWLRKCPKANKKGPLKKASNKKKLVLPGPLDVILVSLFQVDFQMSSFTVSSLSIVPPSAPCSFKMPK